MSVTYANRWDASKLLSEMTDEQKDNVRQEIVERKLLCTVFGRPCNRDLLRFVEKRLSDDNNGKARL